MSIDLAGRSGATTAVRLNPLRDLDAPPLQPDHAAGDLAGLTARWLSVEDWPQLVAPWQALTNCAAPNVFLSPAFALAATAIDPAPDLGAILIERDGFLVGFAAGRFRRRDLVFSLWTHPYAPYCLPLMERGRERDVLTALLGFLAGRGVAALDWPLLDDGPQALALRSIAEEEGHRIDTIDSHQRAALTSAPLALSKDQRRLSRRLGETGDLRHCSTARGLSLTEAVAAFLTLEAEGWKGRKGTAIAASAESLCFFQDIVRGLGESGDARIDLLTLDGCPIAAGVVLSAGDRAWYWKTAYREDLARFSPGVLLSHALSVDLAEDARLDLVDSCAMPGRTMLSRIWPDHVTVTSRYIAVTPGRASIDYWLVLTIEGLRLAIRSAIKRLMLRIMAGRARSA